MDMPPAVANDFGLLKRVGDDRNRIALHPDHWRQEFLGQRQGFAVVEIAQTQQPARQTGFDRVSRVAGGGLLGLHQQRLIDLLFTDLVMPGPINGRRLAIEASKRRPSLKVLYASGYAENAPIHDGRLDADAMLLAKPYRKIEQAKTIRAALAPDLIQDRD